LVVDVPDGDDTDPRVDVRDDGAAPEAMDVTDADECPIRVEREVREGASPGVTCRRITTDGTEYAVVEFTGDKDRIVLIGGTGDAHTTDPIHLWEYERTTACLRIIQRGEASDGSKVTLRSPSVQGERVAYGVISQPVTDRTDCEVRLLEIESGETALLASFNSPDQDFGGIGCSPTDVKLSYPWIAWRDFRECAPGSPCLGGYESSALAIHVQTGELLNLSLDPLTGDQGGCGGVDLHGGVMVFDADWWDRTERRTYYEIISFDLTTRTRFQVTHAIGNQYASTITAGWIVWADQRNSPWDTWFAPCSGDIYGYERSTGTEHALVFEGDALHGPWVDAEGPWIAYVDQRWDPEPLCDADHEQDIVAMHLPTRTEIRITDWRGFEPAARVYDCGDGTFGVLLNQEIDRTRGTMRLWDCDLPEPPGAGP
jgi:hypothetical protein